MKRITEAHAVVAARFVLAAALLYFSRYTGQIRFAPLAVLIISLQICLALAVVFPALAADVLSPAARIVPLRTFLQVLTGLAGSGAERRKSTEPLRSATSELFGSWSLRRLPIRAYIGSGWISLQGIGLSTAVEKMAKIRRNRGSGENAAAAAYAAASKIPVDTPLSPESPQPLSSNDKLWLDASGHTARLSDLLRSAELDGPGRRLMLEGFPDQRHPVPPIALTHPDNILKRLSNLVCDGWISERWCDPIVDAMLADRYFVRITITSEHTMALFRELFDPATVARLEEAGRQFIDGPATRQRA